MAAKVYVAVGPTSVGGVIMGLMTDGKRVWSQMRAGPGAGGVEAGEVRGCMVNPAASPDLLREPGVPESAWVWPERDR